MKKLKPKEVNAEILLPPNMDYEYFENSKRFPFEHNAKKFSKVNAWWLAEASLLAYEHPGFAKLAFRLQGFDKFAFFDLSSLETFCASNNNAAIFGFRGTEIKSVNMVSDVVTDLKFKLVKFPYGGQVHRGFMSTVKKLWPSLKNHIEKLRFENPRIKIFFCGHSLGGAGALIASTIAKNENIKITGLYTFGSPMVGDEKFAKISFEPHYRIVNFNDPIPQVPPPVPAIPSFPGNNYVHTGELFSFDKNGSFIAGDELQENLWQVIDESRKNIRKTKRKVFSLIKHKIKSKFSKKKDKQQLLTIENKEEKNLDLSPEEKTLQEKGFFNKLLSFVKITRTGTHAPVYYSVNTWNNLLKK